MRLLIKQSVLLQLATVCPWRRAEAGAPEDQVWEPHPAPRPGGDGAHRAQRSKPIFEGRARCAALQGRGLALSDETLEDNIERGELRQTIMEALIAEAVARDMEDVVVNGDPPPRTSSSRYWTASSSRRQATWWMRRARPSRRTSLRDLVKSLPIGVPARQEGDAVPDERRRGARLPQPRSRSARTARR